MRGAAITAVVLCVAGVALAQPRTDARRGPPTRRITFGMVAVDLFGDREPQLGPIGIGGERRWTSYESVTQTIVRGPPARLGPVAPGVRGVRDIRTTACGRPAIRRERVVPFDEITSWTEEGSEEVERHPGPAEITLAFEFAGQPWALLWSVSDRRQRGRYRPLERRFFASLRCVE